MLGPRLCVQAFSSCGERGPLPIAARGPLIVVASLVVEHRLHMRRLSSCGSRAQLLRGMWDPPRPGLEPVSSALAGRLSTIAPPGKPLSGYSWFWWPWYLRRVQARYFIKYPSKLDLSDVFLMIRLESWTWRRKTTGIETTTCQVYITSNITYLC